MKRDLMEILACPECRGELRLAETKSEGDEVVAGTLTCVKCGATFPIEDSIPNLLPLSMRS
ncbi:MAG: Trm112 family protein [SAR202 cluster bacterium]|nr:Trm112 family protein [SAR202 cluster bacterium]